MREVVVMTKEAVWFACTVTLGQTTPVGNGRAQDKAYEMAPKSEIVNVADDPAATVLEVGEALKDDGFPLVTFRTVLPPASEPNGATRM